MKDIYRLFSLLTGAQQHVRRRQSLSIRGNVHSHNGNRKESDRADFIEQECPSPEENQRGWRGAEDVELVKLKVTPMTCNCVFAAMLYLVNSTTLSSREAGYPGSNYSS
jgi:hypothetical protein